MRIIRQLGKPSANKAQHSLSIGIYRRLFHRLRNFPGPFSASVTRIWALKTINQGNYFQVIKDLHRKHGDFVRVGPRELDVCNLKAVNAVLASTSPCVKGNWYLGTQMGDPTSVHIQNDLLPLNHTWKRRIWDVGLSSRSLRDYEPHVLHYVDKLLDALARELKKNNGVVDLGLYFSFFTFDVMGELA